MKTTRCYLANDTSSSAAGVGRLADAWTSVLRFIDSHVLARSLLSGADCGARYNYRTPEEAIHKLIALEAGD